MTQTGHLLTGTAIGVVCMPQDYSRRQKITHLLAFALISTIPDWPIKSWGHDRYYFSHSLYVNLLLIGFFSALFLRYPHIRRRIGGWVVWVGVVCAWLSHLLLDSFYNHGLGIAIFWPLSKASLALPIPWLGVSSGPTFPLTSEKIRIFWFEVATFFPLMLLAILIRNLGVVRRKEVKE